MVSSHYSLYGIFLISVVGSLTILWCTKFLLKLIKLYNSAKNVPGPPALPLIGNALLLRETSVDVSSFLDLSIKYPSIFRFWIGIELFFVISSPKYVEKIVNSSKLITKHHVYNKLIKDIGGDGLIASNGSKWRKHRKVISPSFNTRMLEYFVEIFNERAETLVKTLEHQVDVKNLDIYHIFFQCSVDSVCQTSLGLNRNTQGSQKKYGLALEKCFKLSVSRLYNPIMMFDFVWYSTRAGKEMKAHAKFLHDEILLAVEEKKKLHQEQKEEEFELGEPLMMQKSRTSTAILDILMEDSNFTEKEFLEEVSTLIGAATDTTSGSLSFVAVVLAIYPDIQQNVYEEIIDIFGVERPVTPEELSRLDYTERVIKECLRLFPSLPIVARTMDEDVKIGDKVFPDGSGVAINIIALHRNPKYWPDPLKFDPDRFLPEEVAKRNPYVYMPFSLGPRMCIGAKYAMLNMKTLLVQLIRKFKFHTEYKGIEEIKLKYYIVLKMAESPKLWLEKR